MILVTAQLWESPADECIFVWAAAAATPSFSSPQLQRRGLTCQVSRENKGKAHSVKKVHFYLISISILCHLKSWVIKI